jgi:AAA domain
MSLFKKATREQAKLRLALIGPAGAGKTYSSLAIAAGLADAMQAALGRRGRIAVIDTECGSAELYAKAFDFDTMQLATHSPLAYVDAIHAAEDEDYDIILVDSLSHAWIGKDGALEQVDKAADRDPRSNSFTAWRNVTPKHTKLVDAMVSCKKHLIVTIRAKTEFVQEKNPATGKTEIRKIGLAPIQRDGLEYEFTLVGDIDLSNNLKISKTRLDGVIDPGQVFEKPGAGLAKKIYGWLMDGAMPVRPVERPTAPVLPVIERASEIPPGVTIDTAVAAVAAQPELEAELRAVLKLPEQLERVFGEYLGGIELATTPQQLQAAATSPGKPAPGTPEHDVATAVYKRKRAEIHAATSNGVSA